MDLKQKIKNKILENLSHGEQCGENYYGKEGFQCRCGRDRIAEEDTNDILEFIKTDKETKMETRI